MCYCKIKAILKRSKTRVPLRRNYSSPAGTDVLLEMLAFSSRALSLTFCFVTLPLRGFQPILTFGYFLEVISWECFGRCEGGLVFVESLLPLCRVGLWWAEPREVAGSFSESAGGVPSWEILCGSLLSFKLTCFMWRDFNKIIYFEEF